MRIFTASSPLAGPASQGKMGRLKPSFHCSIKQLMALVKCLGVFRIKILKPQHCNQGLLLVLPMEHSYFAYPAHQVRVRMDGIS